MRVAARLPKVAVTLVTGYSRPIVGVLLPRCWQLSWSLQPPAPLLGWQPLLLPPGW